jgi:tRNA-Thr(GGU) m(6)t(6)A37 methyltransferase TsaA
MKDSAMSADKLATILDYWIEHNEGHNRENQKWLRSALEYGNEHIIKAVKKALELSEDSTRQIMAAKDFLQGRGLHKEDVHEHHVPHQHIQYHQIGIIHTPHAPGTPWSEMRNCDTRCSITLDERFSEGLWKLSTFSHVIVLFALNMIRGEPVLTVSPPWAEGVRTGVFASRSPNRPNPIGLSVVGLRDISGNEIFTDNIDAYDESPLLDIKPYIEAAESRVGAGNGWIDELEESLKARVFRKPAE